MIIKSFVSGIFLITCIKIFAIFNTSFNLFGDEAQYWLWSQNIDLGYFSKPPLLAWLIYIYSFLFGDSFVVLKIFPLVFYFITSFAIYKLSRLVLEDRGLSMVCSLSFLIMPGVSVSSFLLSTDVVLLLFWTLSMIVVLEIKKRPVQIKFVLLGLLMGLAFLSKYAAIYFFISLTILYIFDRSFFKIINENKVGVIFFFVVFVFVILPNIVWNFNNGWVTLFHTADNANLKNIKPSAIRGLEFLLIQICMIGPFLFLGLLSNLNKFSFDTKNVFLLCFSFPILFIVFVESFLVRANANWAAVALVAILLLFIRVIKEEKSIYLLLNYVVNLIFGVLLFVLISTNSDFKIFNRISGVNEFSKEVLEVLGHKKNLVVSNRLLYSNLAYELKDENLNFFMPMAPDQKVSNHFHILSPLKKEALSGFVFIGAPSDISYLEKPINLILLKKQNYKFSSLPISIYEVTF